MAALRPENARHPMPRQDPGRPKGLNALGLLAQHPELARAYNTLNGHILFASTLSTRERELVVLRVAAVRGATYEWKQHVIQGRDAGLTDDEIARIAEGPEAGWPPLDAAMLRATDELVRDADISDETWAVLSAALDTHRLMDLVFTVGTYDLLAMAFKAFRVPIDDDLP
jgi:4-carboxymuconolactone decarboxylase